VDHAAAALATSQRATLARMGEYWSLTYEGRTYALKGRRGLEHLAGLLAEPDREQHVLTLAAASIPWQPGEPLLDGRAKVAYRARLAALRDAVDTAEVTGNGDRAARARVEIDAIAAELCRAAGLGGRDRTTPTAADRARAAVTLALRRAIYAIARIEPVLGGHLAAAVKTGFFCAYRPDPSSRLSWSVTR
jgi:hypothetical protein